MLRDAAVTLVAVLAVAVPVLLGGWGAYEAGVRDGKAVRVDEQFRLLGTVKRDAICASGAPESRQTFRCVQTTDAQLWAVPR